MGKRASYSNETKAAAMAALLAGQAVGEVARTYRIPIGTVRAWKSRATEEPIIASEKKQAVGELLIGYLEANLQTLRAQSEFFRDPAWLAKQDASALAVLHGVLADKTVRLLEAMEPAEAETT